MNRPDKQSTDASSLTLGRIQPRGLSMFAFLILHVPLALIISQSRPLATLHALGVFAVGLGYAFVGRFPERLIYVAAYIVGSEVLWRMTRAQVPWEVGKYLTSLILLIAVMRTRQLPDRGLHFLYFVLLLPSTVLTVLFLDVELAREQISSNLSGPFALMVCVWYCSGIKLSRPQLVRLLGVLVGPIISIAIVTLSGILTASDIQFSNDSNFATSGGFGPNQVSSILGLGSLLAFLYVIVARVGLVHKGTMVIAATFLAVQSAITFSRGGLYNAAGALILAFPFLLADRRSRMNLLVLTGLCTILANVILLPRLDAFTGGALTNRFEDTSATNRDDVAWTDLQLWRENPLFGVGPGRGKYVRTSFDIPVAAHTEYSRLVAEHGIFGLFALVLLFVMAAQNVWRSRTTEARAVCIALVAWALIFMVHAGMRLVAPSFIFGLSCALLSAEHEKTFDHSIETSFSRNTESEVAGTT